MQTTSESIGSSEFSWLKPLTFNRGWEAENSLEPMDSDVVCELAREPAIFQIDCRERYTTITLWLNLQVFVSEPRQALPKN